MSKINLDKYYTPPDLAKYVFDKANEIIGVGNIAEYFEPSAGAGVFIDFFNKPYYACDIEPEKDNIVKADFLSLEIEYLRGRCIIGNPPYGDRLNLAVAFFKKAIQISDYIAFILPVSQFNNSFRMYEFDLIYSENLGKRKYSGKEVYCCLNIYRRPQYGLNSRPNYKMKDVIILEGIRSKTGREKRIDKEIFGYDVAICAWGSSCGKEIDYPGQYAQEFYIKIDNSEYKEKVVKLIKETQWELVFPMFLKSNKLQLWRVYKYISDNFPELK